MSVVSVRLLGQQLGILEMEEMGYTIFELSWSLLLFGLGQIRSTSSTIFVDQNCVFQSK